MTDDITDRELLERAWELSDEAFADHVGEILAPDHHRESELAIDWAAQSFTFAPPWVIR